MAQDRFGICKECDVPLEAVLEEKQLVTRNGYIYKTRRVRTVVDYLICPCCLAKHCVDDSFDGPWR